MTMSGQWDEFNRRVGLWQRTGDAERLALPGLLHEGFRNQETDPELSFALFTRGRDEAQRLNEPWWVLFFENWRLTALTCYVMDFSRALSLAVQLMVRFNAPDGQAHPDRHTVLDNVLYTYINIDPLGYRDEIERGFAYLDGQIEQEPTSGRFVLNHRRMSYLGTTERWEEAYDLALRSLALVDQAREAHVRTWHGSWALFELCRICHALGRVDELAGHADHMAELAEKDHQLRRVQADARIWRAVTQRGRGHERDASASFHQGLGLLRGLDRRDWVCADPVAAYYEAAGDQKAALGVRDRELAAIAKKGMLHRVCQVHIERCRLLASLGELTPGDLDATRHSTGQLRTPDWYLEKLNRIEATGRAEA